jgi:hypothetical protein
MVGMQSMITQMMKALAGRRLLLSALLAATATFSVLAPGAFAQEPTVHFQAASTEVGVNDGPFTLSAVLDDVTNLGAFEFTLTYDPAILRFTDVQEGPFLGSSGRRVQCLPAQTVEGSMRLACVTLGATPDGPSGSGVLANVTFEPLATGSSALRLTRVIITDPSANTMPSQTQDATVTVTAGGGSGGFRWTLWGPIIGGVILALGAASGAAVWWARRSRSA